MVIVDKWSSSLNKQVSKKVEEESEVGTNWSRDDRSTAKSMLSLAQSLCKSDDGKYVKK